MIKIAIVGASGRMGQCLVQATVIANNTELTVAVVRPESSSLGKDAGELAGIGSLGIITGDDLSVVLDQFDTLIDFTRPETSMHYLRLCRDAGKQIIIGTTGYSDAQKQEISTIATQTPIVRAPNMSIGVNLLLKLLAITAKAVGNTCDIEIIEAHHRNKVDAPSGTALRMGEVIADTLGRNLQDCAIYGREGNIGERDHKTIGFSTIRAGDIVGEHTVMFADEDECIEITHKATSRMAFAKGAIRAAIWLKDKPASLYDMHHVLGLK